MKLAMKLAMWKRRIRRSRKHETFLVKQGSTFYRVVSSIGHTIVAFTNSVYDAQFFVVYRYIEASKDKGILRYPKWIIPANGNVYHPMKYRLFGESSDASEILMTCVNPFHISRTYTAVNS